jgi:hypothetical protein
MYGNSQELPFIVFHYPPLYYLLVRAISIFMPDMLSGGRLISAVSAVLIAPLVAGIVLVAARNPDGRRRVMPIAIAVVAGLLVLCLHAVRTWGLLMRVDMIAIALGLAGVLVAAWADGDFRGTTFALLLCVASVYAKQTQLPAGAAIFLVTLLRRPRSALGAAAITLVVGLAALGALQGLTSGGFLRNIIGYNINRMSWHSVLHASLPELTSLPFVVLMLEAVPVILIGLFSGGPVGRQPHISGWGLVRLRLADRAAAARAIILLHFIFATMMLITIFKSGSYFNYLLDWLSIGSVLIGVLLCDLAGSRRDFALATGLMVAGVLLMPLQLMPEQVLQGGGDEQLALARRIAAADKPVASEQMTLLMRAGKPVIFEPAIATELAALGQWDETPLIEMIRSRGFAFMITGDDTPGGTDRRSPAVDAAMRATYPRVEHVGDLPLWLHLPR